MTLTKNCHTIRNNHKLNMQNYILFVDTESDSEKVNDKDILRFKFGSAIYWDREKGLIEKFDFEKIDDFWNFVNIKLIEIPSLIIYAHNMRFDFKMLDGWEILPKMGFNLKLFYEQQSVFIVEYVKKYNNVFHNLSIWSTTNYFQKTLKELGKQIGLNKMEIDFKDCSLKELKVYCRNDTEIIFKTIKYLIEFLVEYDLSKLMPTIGSLSKNIFQHKFHNRKLRQIYIHEWIKAIELERESYSGGIADIFKYGKFSEEIYKLDINSMYPFQMKEKVLPTKLLLYTHDGTDDNLRLLYENAKKKGHISIARVKIYLPKEYAYILKKAKHKGEEKSLFMHGNFEVTLCQPELEFVEKHGKILQFRELAVYKADYIFRDFVDFFFNKRLEFKENGNKVYDLFCKIILNSQYGKWGQKQIIQTVFSDEKELPMPFMGNGNYITLDGKSYSAFKVGENFLKFESGTANAKDSFVAISSFITSYARMHLVDLILKSERKNTYYCDTDSLFVNEKGLKNLENYINNKELGYLKLEETGVNCEFYNPKQYIFNSKLTIKGVKKGSKPIKETDKCYEFEQERWHSFKSGLKNNEFSEQIIEHYNKIIDKNYSKGLVLANGDIEPFEAKEV